MTRIPPWLRFSILGIVIAGLCAACGSTTTTSTKPTVVRASLSAITCSATERCVAVGSFLPADADSGTGDPDGDGDASHTLIDTLVGSTWKVTPSPNAGKGGAAFSSVSCASATHCVAVGFYQPKPDTLDSSTPLRKPLIAEFTGKKWTLVTSPTVAPNSVLLGVSCSSTTHCFAVGYSTTSAKKGAFVERSFIEAFDGSTWHVTNVTFPQNSSTTLTSVACRNDGSCEAVGNYATKAAPTVSLPLIESFSADRWAPSAVPAADAIPGILYSVSCTTSTCFAVGESEQSNATSIALVLMKSSSNWVSNTNEQPTSDQQTLTSVACATTTCLAVGTSSTALSSKPNVLVAAIGPATWRQRNVTGSSGYVSGIACPSTLQCTAVGSAASKTLLATITGSNWSTLKSPAP